MHPGDGLVVVVNYNQEREIARFLSDLKEFWPVEKTLVIDDASTDGSGLLAAAAGYEVLQHATNRGVGAAIASGIRAAQERRAQFVAILSSNGKMLPSELARVIAPILANEADYVTGSRFLENGGSASVPFFRRYTIPLASIFLNLFLQFKYTDVTCGYRAYRLTLFDDPRFDIYQPWLERYQLEYYQHFVVAKYGFRIQEVPVHIVYGHLEKGRRSKITPIVDWWKMLSPILFLWLRIKK